MPDDGPKLIKRSSLGDDDDGPELMEYEVSDPSSIWDPDQLDTLAHCTGSNPVMNLLNSSSTGHSIPTPVRPPRPPVSVGEKQFQTPISNIPVINVSESATTQCMETPLLYCNSISSTPLPLGSSPAPLSGISSLNLTTDSDISQSQHKAPSFMPPPYSPPVYPGPVPEPHPEPAAEPVPEPEYHQPVYQPYPQQYPEPYPQQYPEPAHQPYPEPYPQPYPEPEYQQPVYQPYPQQYPEPYPEPQPYNPYAAPPPPPQHEPVRLRFR